MEEGGWECAKSGVYTNSLPPAEEDAVELEPEEVRVGVPPARRRHGGGQRDRRVERRHEAPRGGSGVATEEAEAAMRRARRGSALGGRLLRRMIPRPRIARSPSPAPAHESREAWESERGGESPAKVAMLLNLVYEFMMLSNLIFKFEFFLREMEIWFGSVRCSCFLMSLQSNLRLLTIIMCHFSKITKIRKIVCCLFYFKLFQKNIEITKMDTCISSSTC